MKDNNNWFNTDPREFFSNARAGVALLRPHPNGYGAWLAGTGEIDTKHGYSLTTSFHDYPTIEDWNEDWFWTHLPMIQPHPSRLG